MKNRFLRIISLLSILFILLSTVGIISSTAMASDIETRYKYITKIEVKYGDTLWDIANEYLTEEYDDINEYIKEIMFTNNLKSNKIIAEQILIIPYYSSVEK